MTRTLLGLIGLSGAVISLGTPTHSSQLPDDYQQHILSWRKDVESSLTADEGWLAVSGLHWLQQGANSIGTSTKSNVVLPIGSGAAIIGTLALLGDQVTFTPTVGVKSTFNGAEIGTQLLRSDADRITTGSIKWMVIHRGSRFGVRVYDLASKARKEFKGCRWFPIQPQYRIEAAYTAYDKPKQMNITNVLGDTAPVENPGYVTFTVGGKVCRLEAQSAGGGFFFNFRDLTSGKSTYPAGRFLDAPAPENGKVVLDFNQATNPPCAFTAFATCPLPPKENYLNVAIPAGEKSHHPVK